MERLLLHLANQPQDWLVVNGRKLRAPDIERTAYWPLGACGRLHCSSGEGCDEESCSPCMGSCGSSRGAGICEFDESVQNAAQHRRAGEANL